MVCTINKWSLALFFLLAAAAEARTSVPVSKAFSLASLNEVLERRVSSVIRQTDPSAVVSLKVKAKEMVVRLPATPFTYEGLQIDDSRGDAAIDEINVVILTDQTEFPASVVELVKESLSLYGPAHVSFRPLAKTRTVPTHGK